MSKLCSSTTEDLLPAGVISILLAKEDGTLIDGWAFKDSAGRMLVADSIDNLLKTHRDYLGSSVRAALLNFELSLMCPLPDEEVDYRKDDEFALLQTEYGI